MPTLTAIAATGLRRLASRLDPAPTTTAIRTAVRVPAAIAAEVKASHNRRRRGF